MSDEEPRLTADQQVALVRLRASLGPCTIDPDRHAAHVFAEVERMGGRAGPDTTETIADALHYLAVAAGMRSS